MNKKNFRKKAGLIGLVIFLLIIAAIYLNRAYAHVYNKIDGAALLSPDHTRTHVVLNNQEASSSLVYVALGDSLSAGVGADSYEESFPYLLAQYFAGNDRSVVLENRAVPGAKSSDLLCGLLPGAITDDPDVVTLLIGINDLHGQISLEQFRDNYDKIVKRLTTETKAKVYLINLPFIGSNQLLLPPYNYFFNQRTKQYNEIILEIAEKYSVSYIDLYLPTEELLRNSGSHYASDFFHPSAEGYKIWADLIYADLNY